MYKLVLDDTVSDEEKERRAGTWAERRAHEKVWKDAIKRAVSIGQLTPQQADKLDWYPSGGGEIKDYGPLPDELYHVSTGAEGILRHGLKTREQLTMQNGSGLGGGADDTISFTTDLKTARVIRAAMFEARRVARGELTVPMMLSQAKAMPDPVQLIKARGMEAKNRLTVSSAYDFLMRYHNANWKPGDPEPESIELLRRGERSLSGFGTVNDVTRLEALVPPGDHHGFVFKVASLPAGYRALRSWKNAAGEDVAAVSAIVRKMTKDEEIDAAFDFYKQFASGRDYAGGRMDPLFFATDHKALARTKTKDIRIFKFKPKPGAHGYKVSSLGEWRAHFGDVVRLTGVVEAAS